MRYSDVLTRLLIWHGVGPEQRKSFHDDIKHLRRVGALILPKTQRGGWSFYHPQHVAEIHLAMSLRELRIPAKHVGGIIAQLRAQIMELTDGWLIVCPDGSFRIDERPTRVAKSQRAVVVVNLAAFSKNIRKFKNEWDKNYSTLRMNWQDGAKYRGIDP